MADLLLDTNVISEIRKRQDKMDSNVMHWLHAVDLSSCQLSVISLLEARRGILSINRRDTKQGEALLKWLDGDVVPSFKGRIIPVDLAIAAKAADLQVPNPRSLADALIAATALVYNLTVVTRNVNDFLPCGVRVINPWDSGDVLKIENGTG